MQLSDRSLRRLGLALFGLVILVLVATLALSPGLANNPKVRSFRFEVGYLVNVMVIAGAALVLVWSRPRNSVGWLLGGTGLLAAVCELGQVYGAHALAVEGSRLPLGSTVLSWSAPLWVPTLFIPATLLLARYPGGSLPPGRWPRRVDRLVLLAFALVWVGYAGSEFSTQDEVPASLPPVVLPKPVAGGLMLAGAILLLGCLLVIVTRTIRTMLRASWPERPQIALLLTATTLAVVLVIFSPWEWLGDAAFFLLPAAVAIGVLRYRLLGIELVVRRTLVYGALTGVVLTVFVAVTSGVTALVPEGPAPRVVAASVVAVLLAPARDRLQRGVDRLLYGDRTDPWRALSRLGKEAAEGSALHEVVAAVAQSLRLPGAELRMPDSPAVTWGQVPAESVSIPLVAGDLAVGELVVAPRRGEKHLGPADERMLVAIAPLVALVLRSHALSRDVEVERERVVQATEVERARIRRDLHDGLGPSLTGMGLGLEAIDSDDLPDRYRAIVARLRAEAGASLEEVRRIIDDLRPGALETGDLLSLLNARAAHVSATTPVRVELALPDALPPLEPAVEAAALRIAEEAITNVLRHAQATQCTVRVDLDDELRIQVQDNGVGFSGLRDGGIGVPSMSARAAALGGTCDLTGDENGSLLQAVLPLRPPR